MFQEGRNVYYTNQTANQYYIHYLNPFHPAYTMKVTIDYPLIPNYSDSEKKKVAPEISLGDVFKLMPHFRDEFEKLNDVYVMFEFLLSISKQMVSYEIVGDDKIYKYLVSLHAAHHITTHIRDMKDEANLNSLNDEVVEKNYHIKDVKALMEKGIIDSFYTTSYGMRFLEHYTPLVNLSFKGSIGRRNRGI